MDRGVRWATVHRAANRQTWLKQLSTHAGVISHSGAFKWQFLLAVLNSTQGQALSAEAALRQIAALDGADTLWHCWWCLSMQLYPPQFFSLAGLKVMEACCHLLLYTTQLLLWSSGPFSQSKASRVPAEPSLGTDRHQTGFLKWSSRKAFAQSLFQFTVRITIYWVYHCLHCLVLFFFCQPWDVMISQPSEFPFSLWVQAQDGTWRATLFLEAGEPSHPEGYVPWTTFPVNPHDQHLLISCRQCEVEGREWTKLEGGGRTVGVAGATNNTEEISRDAAAKTQEAIRKD